MAMPTTAAEWVQFWLNVEYQIKAGQTIQHGDRRYSIQNISEVMAIRKDWEKRADAIAAGAAGKDRRVKFMDWYNA